MWFRESRRLKQLEERLDRAENELKLIALDWENVYRKLRKIMGRLHKEDAIKESHEPGKQEEMPVGEGSIVNGRLLTARQMEVQQQILRRRGRG